MKRGCCLRGNWWRDVVAEVGDGESAVEAVLEHGSDCRKIVRNNVTSIMTTLNVTSSGQAAAAVRDASLRKGS